MLNLRDYLTIFALIAGPILAVAVTFWGQDRSTKRAAKERLFETLMAHRKSNPISTDWVDALNLIDVVFASNQKVVSCWHSLYEVLNTIPLPQERFNHSYITLLSEMAKVLGYRSLQQTDIDKFYSPQAHGDQAMRSYEVQIELLRVLKGTKNLNSVLTDAEKEIL